jgi:hypothetical protein
MGEVGASLANNVGGLFTLAVAILYIAYAIRNDAAKTLAKRLARVEMQLHGEIRRRMQLESILLTNGIQIPAWRNYPDDPLSPV